MIRIKRKSIASDFDMVDETFEKRPKVYFNPFVSPGNISSNLRSTSVSPGLTPSEACRGPLPPRASFK